MHGDERTINTQLWCISLFLYHDIVDMNYGRPKERDQTASVHCNDNHLKHLNLIALAGVQRGGTDKETLHWAADKDTAQRNLRQGEFGGMFEWENNLIPSLGCVLTSAWQLFTAERLWCSSPLGHEVFRTYLESHFILHVVTKAALSS